MSEHDEEKANERGFVVVDRRGDADAEEAAEVESPPQAGAPSGGASALPKIDLPMLLHSFAISALFHMGAAPDPETGEAAEVDLPLAQQNIQILELIQQKTQGNLTDDEKQLLDGLLYELRMRYVEARKSPQ